jgi:hypothetical protein
MASHRMEIIPMLGPLSLPVAYLSHTRTTRKVANSVHVGMRSLAHAHVFLLACPHLLSQLVTGRELFDASP